MENVSKIVFLILHYYTINDTIDCINSIKQIKDVPNYEIVVVDNASPNKTGQELKDKYINDEHVHILINTENLGFAKGNNVGFKYAKNQLKADFIVMMNNDTKLIQNNSCNIIVEEFENSKFAVLGPKIILPNNKINPIITELPTIQSLQKQLVDIKLSLVTSYLFMNKLYKFTKNLLKKILVKLRIKKKIAMEVDVNRRHENIVLHGCFLVFSKKYIEKFDGLDDRTFLYREEELLTLRLIQNDLKIIYNPTLQIIHNEDGSTNAINKSNRKKEIFICKNQIKSTKILLEEMEKYYSENEGLSE